MAWNKPLGPSLRDLALNYFMLGLWLQVLMVTCLFLMLYVDDIIVTGNHPSFISSLIHSLSQEFDLKDLGRLHYFLGLQINYTSAGLFVHQSKYAFDLFHKFSMSECKPCKTPCFPNTHLVPHDSPLLPDPTLYRSMVGALQYLIFIRPNLSFAVQQACRFMANPTSNHL